jgi:DNA-binding LacI/PurR family transcriptional regulator
VISDAIRGMDGIFFLPFAEDFPADVIRLLQSAGKLIVVERDLSAQGLPSLQILPPRFVGKLLEQSGCAQRGPVACLNTQPMDALIRARIDHWRLWAALHRVEGPLFDLPVVATHSAADHARHVVRGLLQDGRLAGARSLFCTTTAAAFGAMRAMADCGLRPGVDLPVCSADSGFGTAENYIPSLTCLYSPPMEPFIRLCLDWMAAADQAWPGTLLMQPTDVPVFLGESTGQGAPPRRLSGEQPTAAAVPPPHARSDAVRPCVHDSRREPAPSFAL